jgi:hypothetical protein
LGFLFLFMPLNPGLRAPSALSSPVPGANE